MKLERIEVRRLTLPLRTPFETSFGRTEVKQFLLVSASADGVTGLGECVADVDPFYLPETNETVLHVLRDFLAPIALGLEIAHPRELLPAFARVRGHQMAKAALEMAVFELWARREREPLWRVLGGRSGEIQSGVSIGLQRDDAALVESVAREVAAGYRRVKIKIKPGRDRGLVEAVRRRFPELPLMVDANSAYTLADAERLAELDRFSLMMIEQPLGWDDIVDHATLQKRLATAICLDESIHGEDDARRALELGACRIVNVKVGRVGGFAGALAVHDLCRARGRAGLVRRHARIRDRPARERAPADAARLRAAGRHLGERALLRRGPGRSAGGGHAARDDRGARAARDRSRRGVVAGRARDRLPRGLARLSRSTAPTR